MMHNSYVEEPTALDYYECLGVHPYSSVREIRRAFYRLAKVHHPDKQAPGTCSDAEDFRKVREAQETLCDEIRRRNYDRIYPSIHYQWTLYRKQKEDARINEEGRRAAQERIRQAEAEAIRRRAEEYARWQQEENEKARRLAEFNAWQEAEARRKKEIWDEEMAQRQRLRKEQESVIRRAEEAQREKLRAQKEREAEERSRNVARLARERQEQDAIERIQKNRELRAEEERERIRKEDKMIDEQAQVLEDTLLKEKELIVDRERVLEGIIQEKQNAEEEAAARNRREQQNIETKGHPARILVEAQQAKIRKNWTMLREKAMKAEKTESHSMDAESGKLPRRSCIHPTFGWPRRKGATTCSFCESKCAKFSFRCPDCEVAACPSCKSQRFSSI